MPDPEIEALAKILRPWTVCDNGSGFDHGSERAAQAVLDSMQRTERYLVHGRGFTHAIFKTLEEAEEYRDLILVFKDTKPEIRRRITHTYDTG